MKKQIPDRITLRLGELREPAETKLAATGETISQYIRRLVAEDLDIDPPKMPEGNPNFGAEFGNGKKGSGGG